MESQELQTVLSSSEKTTDELNRNMHKMLKRGIHTGLKLNLDKCLTRQYQILWSSLRPRWAIARTMGSFLSETYVSPSCKPSATLNISRSGKLHETQAPPRPHLMTYWKKKTDWVGTLHTKKLSMTSRIQSAVQSLSYISTQKRRLASKLMLQWKA